MFSSVAVAPGLAVTRRVLRVIFVSFVQARHPNSEQPGWQSSHADATPEMANQVSLPFFMALHHTLHALHEMLLTFDAVDRATSAMT
jgi:hypothetical protein